MCVHVFNVQSYLYVLLYERIRFGRDPAPEINIPIAKFSTDIFGSRYSS